VPASIANQAFGAGGRPPGSSGSTPSSTPRSTIPSQYQAAFQSCRSDLPTGNFNPNSTQLRAYEQCLQIHGVPVPSTPPTTTGSGGAGFAGGAGSALGSLRNNPAYSSAFQACASLLPAPTGTGSSTTVPAS
jgi:hypothetical protein